MARALALLDVLTEYAALPCSKQSHIGEDCEAQMWLAASTDWADAACRPCRVRRELALTPADVLASAVVEAFGEVGAG